MTPEAKVKGKVIQLLGAYPNIYWFMPVANLFTRAGVPDLVACLNGQFIGIECKAGNNTPTKLQELNLERIQTAGGIAIVVRENNLSELKGLLDNVSSGRQRVGVPGTQTDPADNQRP